MRVTAFHVVRAASVLASTCRPEIRVLDCLEPQEASPHQAIWPCGPVLPRQLPKCATATGPQLRARSVPPQLFSRPLRQRSPVPIME